MPQPQVSTTQNVMRDSLTCMSATLRSIADAAGVSVSSVSRALAGRGDLRRETRERILTVARELGYSRADEPRGRPAALDSRLIELVLGGFDDAWTDAITAGARQSAFSLGFDLVLTLERDDPADDWPTRVATRRPAGVILGIIRPTHRQLQELRGLTIPLVLLDPRSDPEGELASVGTTDGQGGYDAGAHLVRTGAERFVLVGGTPPYRFGRAREEGFRRAIAQLAPSASVTRVESPWNGMLPTRQLLSALSSGAGPVGVFACSDQMAVAVYRAAEQLGLRIPEDVGVVGFNDDRWARSMQPPLSTIKQPLHAMAARAVELVHELRQHGVDRHERIELPSELVVRGSTSTRPPA